MKIIFIIISFVFAVICLDFSYDYTKKYSALKEKFLPQVLQATKEVVRQRGEKW